MMLRFLWLIAIVLGCISNSAQGELVLLGYDSTNPNGPTGAASPDLAAAESASFIDPLQLSRGSGVAPNQGIAFNSSDWSLEDTVDFASDKFIQWGWGSSTQSVDLTSLTLQYDVSPSGPSQLAIALSVNGGAFTSIFTDSFVDPSDETHTIGLTAFDNVDSATFRLFGFDAASSGGTLDIEEIVDGGRRGILVRGDLSAVPEPGSLAVIGLVVAVGIASRRRLN